MLQTEKKNSKGIQKMSSVLEGTINAILMDVGRPSSFGCEIAAQAERHGLNFLLVSNTVWKTLFLTRYPPTGVQLQYPEKTSVLVYLSRR